jgi:predicted RNA binding protein YcfA (HicA-like mRNA interferase family)
VLRGSTHVENCSGERARKQKTFHQLERRSLAESLPAPSQATSDLPRMKVREILKLLKDNGWYVIITQGSHRQLKHPAKPGRTTLSVIQAMTYILKL